MNRYPLWKYIIIVFALLFGVIYTTPNFFGQAPAVQISSGKATLKVTNSTLGLVEQALQKNGIQPESIYFEQSGTAAATVRARFRDTDTQFKARAVLEKELNRDPADPSYV
ncbi:MAG: secD, partial [Paucimonas sp.]|nr:secD [Paucimonas sp.]